MPIDLLEQAGMAPATGGTDLLQQAGIQPTEEEKKARDRFVNRDVTLSVANIPRDIAEGAVSILKEKPIGSVVLDWAASKTEPGSIAGQAVRGIQSATGAVNEALAPFLAPAIAAAGPTPTLETVRAQTEKVLPHYESQTGIGKTIRVGGAMAAPFLAAGLKPEVKLPEVAPLQSAKDFKNLAGESYTAAREAGIAPTPQQYQDIVDRMRTAAGARRERYPESNKILNEFESYLPQQPTAEQTAMQPLTGVQPKPPAPPPDMQTIDQIRSDLGDLIRRPGITPKDKLQATTMRAELDSAIADNGLLHPNVELGRHYTIQQKKTEALDKVFNDAAVSQQAVNKGDFVGALQSELLKKLKSNAQARAWMAKFPEDEQQLIRMAATSRSRFAAALNYLAKDQTWNAFFLGGPHAAAVAKGLSVAGRLGRSLQQRQQLRGMRELYNITQGVPSVPGGAAILPTDALLASIARGNIAEVPPLPGPQGQ